MKIDIQHTDTFTIDERGRTLQYRNGNGRVIGGNEWMQLTLGGRSISRDLFTQIATAAGHEIEVIAEDQKPPALAPMQWPTHAVIDDYSGAIIAVGTEEQCKRRHDFECHTVRPLASPPPQRMTPEMLDWLSHFGTWLEGHSQSVDAGYLLKSTHRLIKAGAAGGAQ